MTNDPRSKSEQNPLKTPDSSSSETSSEVEKESQPSVYIASEFRGPLPPPEVFEGYGRVLKDAPDRILRMAEADQNGWLGQRRRADYITAAGLLSGFILAITGMVCTTLLVMNDKNLWGAGTILVAMTPIIATLAYRFSRRKVSDRDKRPEHAD